MTNFSVLIERITSYPDLTESMIAQFVASAKSKSELKNRLDELNNMGDFAKIDKRFDEGEVNYIEGDGEEEEVDSIEYNVLKIKCTRSNPSTFADEDLQKLIDGCP